MGHNQFRLVVLIGAVCLSTAQGGVGEAADATKQPDRAAEGKDVNQLVKDVDAEWSARCEKMGPLDPRPALGIWGIELKTVIAGRVSKDKMHDYMLAVTAGGDGGWLGGYHQSAGVQALVEIYAKGNDRAELVEMLSRYFPDKMYHTDVEFWLAYKVRKTLPDGIEVLFDAFDRSVDAKVREKIAASVGRSFRADGLDFGNNKRTVDACRSWYAKNKDRIKPSIRYGDNVMHPTDAYARNGLFVNKAARQRGTEDRKADGQKRPGRTGLE